MAKKSKKNENRRESLRKVKNCTEKKAKEAKKDMGLILQQELAYIQKMKKLEYEFLEKSNREKNEKIMKWFLNIGYVFSPEDGKLIDYYLRNKIMEEPMDFCPIKEVNVYANHPQALTGKSELWYFFTCSRPNEIQPYTDVQGNWVFGEKKDVFYQEEKVGVKQVMQYCEAGHMSDYKIIEYQLDPAPDHMKAGMWFVCKLYKDGSSVDVHNGP